MKAIVFTQFGSPEVLQLKEMAKPTPTAHEVLIKVHATSVSFGDLMARNFKAISPRQFNMPLLFWLISKLSFGINQPKISILGSEFSGEIETVGNAVTLFKPGDQVFGFLGEKLGAYAEYRCMPEDGVLTTKPTNMTYEEAAIVPYGTVMALSLLRSANIQPGQKVLINGASGAIGSAAVQIAKSLGADVTGVCGTPRLDYVKSLGANKVIDYTQEDFTQNGETYDLVFDVLGKASFSKVKHSLNPHGIQLCASFKMMKLLQMLWTSMTGGKKMICTIAPGSREDLIAIKALIEAGKVKALIDKCYPLEQAAEAHRYVEAGHRTGPVAITIAPNNR